MSRVRDEKSPGIKTINSEIKLLSAFGIIFIIILLEPNMISILFIRENKKLIYYMPTTYDFIFLNKQLVKWVLNCDFRLLVNVWIKFMKVILNHSRHLHAQLCWNIHITHEGQQTGEVVNQCAITFGALLEMWFRK